MTIQDREKIERQEAINLADRMILLFNGVTLEVAEQAIGFVKTRLEWNLRHNRGYLKIKFR